MKAPQFTAKHSLFDPFFGRFLSNFAMSARLEGKSFDTTLARKLLQIRFVAFPRVSTND